MLPSHLHGEKSHYACQSPWNASVEMSLTIVHDAPTLLAQCVSRV